MADHIVLQQIAGRKDTVDRINALIDALGITKKASATLSHGVLHVEMAQAKDTMDAIAKGVLPEKVKTYYDKVLKVDARLYSRETKHYGNRYNCESCTSIIV